MNVDQTHWKSTLPRHRLTHAPGLARWSFSAHCNSATCCARFRPFERCAPALSLDPHRAGRPAVGERGWRHAPRSTSTTSSSFPATTRCPNEHQIRTAKASTKGPIRNHRFDLALPMHGSGEVGDLIVQSSGARCVAGFGLPVRPRRQRRLFCPLTWGAGPNLSRLLDLTEISRRTPPIVTHLETFPDYISERTRARRRSGPGRRIICRGCLCVHPGARFRERGLATTDLRTDRRIDCR